MKRRSFALIVCGALTLSTLGLHISADPVSNENQVEGTELTASENLRTRKQ